VSLSTRERRLLGFLGVVAALFALRLLWSASTPATPGAAPVGRAPVAGRRGAAEEGSIPAEVTTLKTDRLDLGERSDLVVGRDPFRFAELAPPPPPPGPSAEELERMRLEQERLRAEPEEQVDLGPQPPEFDLRFLGSFGPRRRPIAVFVDEDGSNIYNAREGDTLQDQFVVAKIGYESVDIGFVDFPDVPTRRLGIAP